MRILRESTLRKMLKETFQHGMRIGYDHAWQMRQIDERHRGAILPGYDIDKDLQEILRRKGCK